MSTDPIPARGLRAANLNQWLAAVGATVIVPGLRLGWSDGARPHAVFAPPSRATTDLASLARVLAVHLPSLDGLAISPAHDGARETLGVKPTPAAYRERMSAVPPGDPTLNWIASDLAAPYDDGSMSTSAWYAAGPGSVRTLHDRLAKCRAAIADVAADIERCLAGTARRVNTFGLGFDYQRILTATDPGEGNWVDPATELLAFWALALHPVRGDGQIHRKSSRITTRGWSGPATRDGSYSWPAWAQSLDVAAIDALLDQFGGTGTRRAGVEIIDEYELVPYQAKASADTTRGYGSRRRSRGGR